MGKRDDWNVVEESLRDIESENNQNLNQKRLLSQFHPIEPSGHNNIKNL